MTNELTARAAIEEVFARYGHLIDAKEYDKLSALFTESAVFDGTEAGVGRFEGRDNVIRGITASPVKPLSHHATNIAIELAADGRSAESHSKWLIVWEDGKVAAGEYRDKLECNAKAEWQLALRRLVVRVWPRQK